MKMNSQFAGLVNHFEWSLGVSSLRGVLDGFSPYNIRGLAPMIKCPVLVLEGEGEYAQTDKATGMLALEFISEIQGPITIHEFKIDSDGWGASHCGIGGTETANIIIFKWLDEVVLQGKRWEQNGLDPELVKKYFNGKDLDRILGNLKCSTI
jgi:hypothetical protein